MSAQSGLKGFDKLRARVPELRRPLGVLRVLFFPVLLFFLVSAFFLIEDITWPFWLLDGEVVIGTIGFLLLTLPFRLKNNLRERFGADAFSMALGRFILPAIGIIFATVARIGTIPGPQIPRMAWYPILPALGWILVIVGAVLWVRAVRTFGVDNLTMMYLFFPRESEISDHAIYAIIRHPIYSAALHLAFGLALLNGSWFGPTLAVIFAVGLWGWVRLVEERELIERFGPSYSDYRKHVPAFVPRIQQVPAFFTFIITGK